MLDSKNGKNGSEKEIDRLLKLIDALARVDTKLDSLDEQYKIDLADIKKKIDDVCKDILDAEKRRVDLVKVVGDLQRSFDRWKIYWSIVAVIGSPALTTLIICLIEHFVLRMW